VQSSLSLTGIGLRTAHYQEILEKHPPVAWFEVHSENYFGDGGRLLHLLDKIRQDYPISLHGVSLSLGSADELNWDYLRQLKNLITRIDPCLLSDHLSWSSINGHYLHDLIPLPYTEETLAQLVLRIQQIQGYLKKQILIENISSYVRYEHSTIPENEFLRELALQSGCGILLDINNVYVSAANLGTNASTYVSALPAHLVHEIHLGGFTSTTIDGKEILIDSHNRHIVPAVWDLYREAIQQLGPQPTIIEWDKDLPSLGTLCLEAYRAEQIMRETHVTTKLTSRTG